MPDAVVVGAGIFGCTVARALRREGRDVLLIDRLEKFRASQASGNLMKPGWYAGLGKTVTDPSLDLLDRLYGVRDLAFRAGKGILRKEVKVHWIPTFQVLSEETHVANVISIAEGSVVVENEGTIEAPLVVVCAGYWTGQLLHELDHLVVGKRGISFRWSNMECENLITPWAPYKQVVQFNEDRRAVWAGDGTAILPQNWTWDRENQSRSRVLKHLGLPPGSAPMVFHGIRPFVKDQKPCFLREVRPGVWCATGGAKNGMVAAGWCAHEILRRTS